MAELRLLPDLEADLESLRPSSARAVLGALTGLAQDPTAGRPLPIGDGTLRELRVGDTRIIYSLVDSMVWVLAVRKTGASPSRTRATSHQWDVFLSYSRSDAEDFARSLATSLSRRGLKVWFDQQDLQLGSSIRRSIEEGLNDSAHAVVVLSPAFLTHAWPEYELLSLAAREAQGERVIVPVWYRVDVDEVARFAPPLADRLAIRADEITPDEVAESIVRAIGAARPDGRSADVPPSEPLN